MPSYFTLIKISPCGKRTSRHIYPGGTNMPRSVFNTPAVHYSVIYGEGISRHGSYIHKNGPRFVINALRAIYFTVIQLDVRYE